MTVPSRLQGNRASNPAAAAASAAMGNFNMGLAAHRAGGFQPGGPSMAGGHGVMAGPGLPSIAVRMPQAAGLAAQFMQRAAAAPAFGGLVPPVGVQAALEAEARPSARPLMPPGQLGGAVYQPPAPAPGLGAVARGVGMLVGRRPGAPGNAADETYDFLQRHQPGMPRGAAAAKAQQPGMPRLLL